MELSVKLSFGDPLYSTCLLQSIEGMKITKTLCDVTLVVGSMELMAHKVILAAASPYFQAMFCTDMKESTQDRIDIQEVEFNILEDIINFFYTSKIKIRDENVYSVMELADLFQVSTLRKACSYYLESTLTSSNCLSTYVRAGMRDYQELEHAAFRYALRNFQTVLQEEEFLHAPIETVCSALDSRLLNVKDEGEVLKGVIRWVKHDQPIRVNHLDQLISKVDLNNVPIELLISMKNDTELSETSLSSHMTRAVSAILEERYDGSYGYNRHVSYNKPSKHRYGQEQEVLLAIGGEAHGMALSSCECFTLGYDKWKCVIPTVVGSDDCDENSRVIPTMKYPRSYAAVVATDYDVFVIGGQNTLSTKLNAFETYNVKTNSWQELCSLPISLLGAGAAFVGKRLHVVGGVSIDSNEERCWMYDRASNSWRGLAPMSKARGHPGVVSVGGSLYALGGIGLDDTHLSCAERYDPGLQRWNSIAPMREARAKMGCAAIEEYIYVMGGFDGTFWLKSVERYNTLTNEWSYLSPMSIPRSDFAATVCDGRIYCLGGHDSIHHLSSVEKYNPRTDRWHCVTSMRNRRFALGSAALHVPLISPGPI